MTTFTKEELLKDLNSILLKGGLTPPQYEALAKAMSLISDGFTKEELEAKTKWVIR